MIPESRYQKGILSFSYDFYDEEYTLREFGIPTENIRIKGRFGFWYIAHIAWIKYNTPDHRCFYYLSLLEHQTYGDRVGHILAYFDWKTASWIELTETWDGIKETVADLDLI